MSTLKNILVLGSTGASGLVFIPIALSHPLKLHLTLLVRSPSKVPEEYRSHPRVTIVEGQLTDVEAVAKAMKGVTSVISLLGAYITLANFINRSTQTPIADSLRVVFDAMRKEGVERCMMLSSIGGFKHPEDVVGWDKYWLFTHIAPMVVVPEGQAEMKAIGQVTSEQADLDWTVFRIPRLHDGDSKGEAVVETAGHLGPEFKGTIDLSRASMAKWILQELEEKKWEKKGVVIGNDAFYP